jgi:hypothetical protein
MAAAHPSFHSVPLRKLKGTVRAANPKKNWEIYGQAALAGCSNRLGNRLAGADERSKQVKGKIHAKDW